MIKRRKFPHIYFGWWTTIGSGLLRLWGHGFATYGFSAFFKPISSELGFSRTAASVPSAIGRFEGAFEAPLAGWLTDRFGPKWVVFSGIFLMSLSLILMNYINSLWAFYVVWGVMLATGTNIALSIPLDTAITNWFIKKRGVAQGIQWVGSGLSGVITLSLIARLINTQGWRMTCVIGGLVMAFVGLPLAWFCFKRHRPEYYGLLPDGAKVEKETTDVGQMIDRGVKYAAEVQEIEFTLRQALRTPVFWLIMIAGAAYNVVSSGFIVHVIPFLTDIGIEPVRAAATMSIYIGVSVPFRLIGGIIVDRLSTNRLRFLIGGAYLLQAIGFSFLLRSQTIPMIYVAFILYGIGFGISFTVPIMVARYFGRKAYGSIRGFQTMFMAPLGIVAPIYAGWVYDTTGTYIPAFTLFAAILAVAVVLLPFAKPPKPPEQITDVRKIV